MLPHDLEAVIGLEVHVQLRTRTKAFCACPVVFAAAPNSAVCPVCLGYPGALPVPNREMALLGARLAIATGCDVHARSAFARKSYFYPDLPKGYQITQLDRPLATGGRVDVRAADGSTRSVRLRRIHLEEDAGKSIHDAEGDDVPPGVTLVDLNRAGTPLAEIVTEPDLRAPAEASDFLSRLRRLVRWIGVSDGNMEAGSLRCDANVSVRPAGTETLGTKVEIKNLNSITHVRMALEHEVARQAGVLRAGGAVAAESRLFDPASGTTRPMRGKEETEDYRYFPDPDLGPLVLDAAWLAEIAASLPEPPEAREARLAADLGLSPADAATLCATRPLADAFEEAVALHPSNARGVAAWFLGDLLARMGDADRQVGRLPVPPGEVARLVARIDDGTISGRIARELFALLCAGARDVDGLIRERGLLQVTDETPIRAAVDAVLAASEAQAAAYRGGKSSTFGWFVGQVMKATGGKASPAVVNRLLRERLDA
ncbi:MAG: Asp-tRNA(Asn)/Glu-tRNA(Gln) amidotransferase subunit GatB [Thermoanaerobaculia bacterium]|jgi:aspartyl-tRNA(Asn)/glutamyl-tRNA(Gln) amidotransferase subunit B|nr:Asp-tRNA(Asn)/Glu-tRNA(Gln) amidotransferase subunit GatB [Thermoanaerobaculia bacterium]